MDITDIRLDMPLVTSGGIQGKVVLITKEGGLWLETEDRTRFPVHVECVKRVSDQCFVAGDKVRAIGPSLFGLTVDGVHEVIDPEYKTRFFGIAVLVSDGYILKPECLVKCEDYGAMTPISQIAKCYKQVEPEQLLMSQEARRVIEYLKATDCPVHIGDIMDGMEHVMSCMAIMDGLIEAREAGIVRLDDGKYSIVRDQTCQNITAHTFT